MANRACPFCGSFIWWWKDDAGCSACVPPEMDAARTVPTPTLLFHPDAFMLAMAPLTDSECEDLLRQLDEEFGGTAC